MDPDVSVEICWENIGFEVDEGKETVTPTSVDAGNAGVGDNDIEESNVLMTSDSEFHDSLFSMVVFFFGPHFSISLFLKAELSQFNILARREGQTLSQVLRFEAKNDDEKKVRADFTDIIYIDD
ncbi:hypothetical protein KIN20_030691 [Parelaphostrongylus tenuis]|uniref:Uncharacterized protein n=1 Tax=Parelaphostrongylus tenuis TaxID=148309 RepID=A0AAD5R4K8_PARTN|nr:hypothetical protein KIN20_030691 [Parelaphostrongylus tenuis]